MTNSLLLHHFYPMIKRNGEMRKKNKAELMNETISDLRYDSTDSSAFHVIDDCAWLYRKYWSKVGNILGGGSYFAEVGN